MLAGIIAAPFIKKNEITLPPPMKLMDYERATFSNLKEQQEKFLAELEDRFTFTVRGEDLVAVIKKENLRRK